MKLSRLICATTTLLMIPLAAFSQTPTTAQGWYTQGLQQLEQQQYDGALKSFSECVKLEPRADGCYSNRAAAHRMKEANKEAIADVNKAIELAPKKGGHYIVRASIYFDLDRFDDAISDYNQAISLDATLAWAYSGRAQAHCKKNNLALAAADEKKVVELGSKVNKTCAEIKQNEAKREELIEAYQAGEYYKAGTAAYAKGDFELARISFSKVIALKPKDFQPYLYRGLSYLQLTKITEARADFDKVYELAPKLPDLYFYRGLIAHKQNNLDQAITEMGKAIELNPKYVEALNARGALFFEKKQFAQAATDYTKSLELKPTGDTLYNRGIAYFQGQNFEGAILDMTQLIQANSKTVQPYLVRAASYCKAGKKDLAKADEKKIIELGGKVETSCQ